MECANLNLTLARWLDGWLAGWLNEAAFCEVSITPRAACASWCKLLCVCVQIAHRAICLYVDSRFIKLVVGIPPFIMIKRVSFIRVYIWQRRKRETIFYHLSRRFCVHAKNGIQFVDREKANVLFIASCSLGFPFRYECRISQHLLIMRWRI